MSLFTDATAWASDPAHKGNTAEGIATHTNERIARGFSRYDWYNFHDYLEFLIVSTCVKVSEGAVLVGDKKVRASVGRVLDLYRQADRLLIRSQAILGELTDGDVSSMFTMVPTEDGMVELKREPNQRRDELFARSNEAEQQAHDLRAKAISIFFTRVFPYLPHSDDRYYTPVTTPQDERATRGIGRQDYTVIRSYLTSIMVEGISWFASPLGHGYHGDSPQQWAQRLHTITTALTHLQVTGSVRTILRKDTDEWHLERKNEYTQGMDNLVTYFFHLWD